MIYEWIAPGLLIALFCVCAVVNPVLFVRRAILKRANAPSLIPLVGGLLGAWGFSLAPITFLSHHAWLPLLADFGTVPWVSYVLWKVWRERGALRG